MDLPAAPAPFRLDLTATPAVVEVDGVDQGPGLAGVVLVAGFGAPTRLELHRETAGAASGVAVVEHHGPVDVATLVRGLNPGAVQAAILAAQEDTDMGADPGTIVLDVVARLLEQEA